MKRRLLAALAVTIVGFYGVVAVLAQSGRSPVEGVWEVRNVTTPKPPQNPVNKPTGLVIFSGNHYSLNVLNNSARPTMALPADKATADQLRAVWGPLVANAGTFKISANTLTMRAAVVKNNLPNVSDVVFEETFTLKGDTLTMTTTRNPNGPPDNPRTLHLVRAK